MSVTIAVAPSAEARSRQPGAPSVPRSNGSGDPFQVVLENPIRKNAMLLIGPYASLTVMVPPIVGAVVGNSEGMPRVPGQPAPLIAQDEGERPVNVAVVANEYGSGLTSRIEALTSTVSVPVIGAVKVTFSYRLRGSLLLATTVAPLSTRRPRFE